MGLQSHYALQKAVYEVLTADGTLTEMVQGVFDFVPTGTEFPYVVFGAGQCEQKKSAQHVMHRHQLRLTVYCRGRSRQELCAIVERLETLLEDADLTLENHQLVLMRVEDVDVRRGNDGASAEATLRCLALTEPMI